MSLQPSTAANLFSNSLYPRAIGSYNIRSENTQLDPISEQIAVKTEDSVLKVVKLFESGAVATFWEAQKKEHSVTWPGIILDKILGWGKYLKPSEESETTKRTLAQDNKREAVQECLTDHGLWVKDNISTGFDFQVYPNKSCAIIHPIEYLAGVYMNAHHTPIEYNELICQIAKCFKEKLNDCRPNCVPCLNATESEKSKNYNGSRVVSDNGSKRIPSLMYLIVVSDENHKPINRHLA